MSLRLGKSWEEKTVVRAAGELHKIYYISDAKTHPRRGGMRNWGKSISNL
jgi:hypothetical protein